MLALLLHGLSLLLVGLYLFFDRGLVLWQRLALLAGLYVAGVITAPIFCLARLHQLRASSGTTST
ncbi:MAG: hypothetical protein ACT4NL_02140 [Pseudomarimonas sp.]